MQLKLWSNWIGHMLEVIIMQLTWSLLIAPDVFPRRHTKISMAFEVEDCFLSFLIEKIGSSQVKLNFDVQPQERSKVLWKKLPYNNGVIQIKQNVFLSFCNGNLQS